MLDKYVVLLYIQKSINQIKEEDMNEHLLVMNLYRTIYNYGRFFKRHVVLPVGTETRIVDCGDHESLMKSIGWEQTKICREADQNRHYRETKKYKIRHVTELVSWNKLRGHELEKESAMGKYFLVWNVYRIIFGRTSIRERTCETGHYVFPSKVRHTGKHYSVLPLKTRTSIVTCDDPWHLKDVIKDEEKRISKPANAKKSTFSNLVAHLVSVEKI